MAQYNPYAQYTDGNGNWVGDVSAPLNQGTYQQYINNEFVPSYVDPSNPWSNEQIAFMLSMGIDPRGVRPTLGNIGAMQSAMQTQQQQQMVNTGNYNAFTSALRQQGVDGGTLQALALLNAGQQANPALGLSAQDSGLAQALASQLNAGQPANLAAALASFHSPSMPPSVSNPGQATDSQGNHYAQAPDGSIQMATAGGTRSILNPGDPGYDTAAQFLRRGATPSTSAPNVVPGTVRLSNGQTVTQAPDGSIVLQSVDGSRRILNPGDPPYGAAQQALQQASQQQGAATGQTVYANQRAANQAHLQQANDHRAVANTSSATQQSSVGMPVYDPTGGQQTALTVGASGPSYAPGTPGDVGRSFSSYVTKQGAAVPVAGATPTVPPSTYHAGNDALASGLQHMIDAGVLQYAGPVGNTLMAMYTGAPSNPSLGTAYAGVNAQANPSTNMSRADQMALQSPSGFRYASNSAPTSLNGATSFSGSTSPWSDFLRRFRGY